MTLPSVKDEHFHGAYLDLSVEATAGGRKEDGENDNAGQGADAVHPQDAVQSSPRGAQLRVAKGHADGHVALQGHRCQSNRRDKSVQSQENI